MRIVLYTMAFISFVQVATSQNMKHPIEYVDPVDSASNSIDSLISHQAFTLITSVWSSKKDSSKSTIEYYIDTKNLYLVKCIFDTTFEDFYKTKIKRVIIYFYKGYEFNAKWIESATSTMALGYSSGNFLEDFKLATVGKLKKGWTKRQLDFLMRKYISSCIYEMKFMQSRNFGG